MYLSLEIRQPTHRELLAIIRAAANPRRRGGAYRLGIQGAFNVWSKRARAVAEHNHYRRHESAALKRRTGGALPR